MHNYRDEVNFLFIFSGDAQEIMFANLIRSWIPTIHVHVRIGICRKLEKQFHTELAAMIYAKLGPLYETQLNKIRKRSACIQTLALFIQLTTQDLMMFTLITGPTWPLRIA